MEPKIPGGAPFSQLHKSGNGSRVRQAITCNLQRRIKQQNGGSNKFLHRGGREDETDARAEHQTHWLGASNEWMMEPR